MGNDMNVAVVNAEKVEFGTYTLSFFLCQIKMEFHLFFVVGIDNSFQCFLSVGTFVAVNKRVGKLLVRIQFFFEDKPIIVGNIEQR